MKYLAKVKHISGLHSSLEDLQKEISTLDTYLKKYFPEDGFWEFEAEGKEITEIQNTVNYIRHFLKYFYIPQIEVFEAPQGVRRVDKNTT